jgi:hypothetical protein
MKRRIFPENIDAGQLSIAFRLAIMASIIEESGVFVTLVAGETIPSYNVDPGGGVAPPYLLNNLLLSPSL